MSGLDNKISLKLTIGVKIIRVFLDPPPHVSGLDNRISVKLTIGVRLIRVFLDPLPHVSGLCVWLF